MEGRRKRQRRQIHRRKYCFSVLKERRSGIEHRLFDRRKLKTTVKDYKNVK